jgi:general secretion pathway protein G
MGTGTKCNAGGFTLVEVVCASAIMLLLAGLAIPVGSTMVKRQKELELRRNLRTIREAIDRFQADVERIPTMRNGAKLDATNEEGYPQELEQLYEGVDIGDPAGTKLKYLRRLPLDPMTGKADWLPRSSRDEPDSLFSDGVNIFDVRSRSEAVSLGGTRYKTW